MNKVSKKQAKVNRLLSEIKSKLIAETGSRCAIRGCYVKNPDLMHLLPRSLYPEYATEEWNLVLGCRECHNDYDNSVVHRRNSGLYERVAEHDKLAADRYFQMN